MKKILFLIIALFISFNVYAEDYNYKQFNYIVTIDGEKYVASVKYLKNGEDKYELDPVGMSLTNGDGEKFVYNYNDSYYRISRLDFAFCTYNDIYACNGETEFSEAQIEDPEFMINYLPKFIKINNAQIVDGRAAFLFYIGDESNVDNANEKENLYNDVKKYLIKSYVGNNNLDIQMQEGQEFTTSDDLGYNDIGILDYIDLNDMSTDDYLKKALILKKLVEAAKDVTKCTEDDLNKIRTKRGYNLLDLKDVFDNVPLSNECNEILFGDGLGNGNLFENVIFGWNYMMEKKGALVIEEKLTMSFLCYETYYLEGVGILTGELMQKDNEEPVKCSLFGDNTTEIFQYIFTIMKYSGVIVGTLLGIVDIFKIIVSKDNDGKKQFKILSKRIIAIVALILTPVLVEIIFNFVNTIGINDPICGIR